MDLYAEKLCMKIQSLNFETKRAFSDDRTDYSQAVLWIPIGFNADPDLAFLVGSEVLMKIFFFKLSFFSH